MTGVFPDGSPERLGPRSSGGPWAPASPQVLTGTSHVSLEPGLARTAGRPMPGAGLGAQGRGLESGSTVGAALGVQGRGTGSGSMVGAALGAQGQGGGRGPGSALRSDGNPGQ